MTPQSGTTGPTPTGTTAPETGSTGPVTQVSSVWPGPGWHITTSTTDLCNAGGSEETDVSSYSRSGTAFTCGITAQGLLACTKGADGLALCLTDYASRQAVRFPTKAQPPTSGAGRPQPLSVLLANGLVCSAVGHDESPHFDNRRSWLSCGTAGVLLLPPGAGSEDGDRYFTRNGSTWTAQFSKDGAAPQTVEVSQVVYAR